jgi:hypothetical protein
VGKWTTFTMDLHNQMPGPNSLTDDDINALKHMLEHKLYDVHERKVLYTLEEIVNGVQDPSRPYVT